MIKKAERINLKIKDKEWSIAVKIRDGNKCFICGKSEYLNSHHIIPRQIKQFRHDILNGITLCPLHHKYSNELSAHKNPFMFFETFKDKRLEQYLNLISKLYEQEEIK